MSYCHWEQEKRFPSIEKAESIRHFLGKNAIYLADKYSEFKEKVYTTSQVCKILEVKKYSFETWIQKDKIFEPAYNISGQSWIFSEGDVEMLGKMLAGKERRNRS